MKTLINSQSRVSLTKNLYLRFLAISILLLVNIFSVYGQAGCGGVMPSFDVDFTGNVDSIWASPDTPRCEQTCWFAIPNRCIEFIVTMDPNAWGIVVNCASPPCPPGFFSVVDCDPATITPLGTPTCLTSGDVGGTYSVTICKSGADYQQYTISSIPAAELYDENWIASFSPTFTQCLSPTIGADSIRVPLVSPDTISNFQITFGDPYADGGFDTYDGNPSFNANTDSVDGSGVTWMPGDTIWHTYDSLGIYTVCITDNISTYCLYTICGTVINDRSAVAKFTAIPDETCSSEDVLLSDSSLFTVSWDWYFGDGSSAIGLTEPAQSPTHAYYNPSATQDTSYIAMLIAKSQFGQCPDTIKDTILIRPMPVSNFTFSGYTACSTADTLNIQFTNTSIGKPPLTYFWDFGDGDTSLLQDPSHTFINDTTITQLFDVTLTTTSIDGCVNSFTQAIPVFKSFNVDFLAEPDTGCSPLSVQFLFQGDTAEIDTLFWNFGDGATSYYVNPVHTYSNYSTINDTTYQVTLIAQFLDGCMDTVEKYILVYPKPFADFTVNPDTGCSPLTVTITNLAAGYDSLYWDYGDGSPIDTTTSATFMHTYINTTDSTVTYNLCLIAETQYGCTDTLCRAIVVYPEISADFVSLPSVGCHPHTVNFINLSSGEDFYEWDFGDGGTSTLENPVWTFICLTGSDSTYIVELVVSSVFGCGSDTARDTILVYCKPAADFTVNADTGCVPFTAIITNLSTGYDSLYWDFGDGETDSIENPVHVYDSTGIYNITLILTNENCSDTATCLIVVDFCTGISQLQDAGYNLQVYPNPFSATANITISNISQRTKNVEFVIYDIMGRKIKTYIIKNNQTTLTINAKDIGTGLFFVQLIADEGIIASGKMIIVE